MEWQTVALILVPLTFLFIRWLSSDRSMSFFDFACFDLIRFLGLFDTLLFFPAKRLRADKSKPFIFRAAGGLVICLVVGVVVLLLASVILVKIFKPYFYGYGAVG